MVEAPLRRSRAFHALFASSFALCACGTSSSVGLDSGRDAAETSLEDASAGDAPLPVRMGFVCSPATLALNVGAAGMSLRATLTVPGSMEERLNGRPGLVWRSSNTAVLYVDAAGSASGRAEGTAEAWAEYQGSRSSSCMVTVQRPGVSRRLSIEPTRLTLAPGDARPLVVQQSGTDGTITDVTAMAVWSSSMPAVATWNSSMGKVVGLTMGTTELTATVGGATATTRVTVLRPLRRIDVDPAVFTMQRYTTLRVQALGTYDDGSRVNVTESVEWASELRDLVRVEPDGEVRALAVTPGPVTLRASASWGVETPVIAQASVTVREDEARSITVRTTPDGPLTVGTTAQARPLCTFSDGSTADVAGATGTTFRSSDTTVLAVSTTGALTPLRAGTSVLSVSFRGVTGDATVTVNAR